jgi:hypothetical protein
MSGLLRRLTRRRAATADETQPTTPESSEPAAAPAETPAEAAGDQPVAYGPGNEQPTEMIPATGVHAAGGADSGTDAATGSGAETAATGDTEPVTAGEAEAVTAGDAEAVTAGDAVPVTATGDGKSEAEKAGDATAGSEAAPAGEATTTEAPTTATRDLPAGVDPAELELAPLASARRGKLRRRLRYLRRARELLLRDLGGFSYELQRTAGGVIRESHRRLSETKTTRIATVDAEIRELEGRLKEPHAEPVLREPGIGGTCPECGELHSSDARYCWHCGAPLDAKARAERDAAIKAAAQPQTGAHPTPEPQPASVLWAAGPRPQSSAQEGKPEDHTATSEWLAAGATPASENAQTPGESPGGGEARPAEASPGDRGGAESSSEPAGESSEPAGASGATSESMGEPSEPTSETSEPVAETSEPTSEVPEPTSETGESSEPAGKASEPTSETGESSEPAGKASEPESEASESSESEGAASEAPEPAGESSEPAGEASEPAGEASESSESEGAASEAPESGARDALSERPDDGVTRDMRAVEDESGANGRRLPSVDPLRSWSERRP